MEERLVNEQQFMDVLVIWHNAARNLVTLPRIFSTSKGIQISVVSIDNTVEYIYELSFDSYCDALCWLGKLIDDTILGAT